MREEEEKRAAATLMASQKGEKERTA